MAPHSPLPQPALSHMTGVNRTDGMPTSVLPHAFRYPSIKRGRRNCSAALSLKAAPCRSRSPQEVPGRFGSAVSPLVGSAENWWSKEESLSFPADGGKEGTVSPSLPAPAIPAPRGQHCRHGDAGAVGMHSLSWELACTEGAGGNTVVIIYLSINDMTWWEVGFTHLAGFSSVSRYCWDNNKCIHFLTNPPAF